MFWPFRLLIASIMALVILIMIISAINYFHDQQLKMGYKRFAEGFKEAIDAVSADGTRGLVVKKGLALAAGEYAVIGLAKNNQFPEECIEFQAIEGTAFQLFDGGKGVKIKRDVTVDVYYLCVLENSTECEIRCYISFAKKPEVP